MADRKGVLSFGKRAGMYAFTKDKARSHTSHNCRCSRQAKSPPNVIDGLDASAMCAHKVRHLELFHLVRSPIQLLIRRWKKVQSADDCLHWLVGKFLPGKREYVDDSRVPATSDHD
jgi:hypothetical protein